MAELDTSKLFHPERTFEAKLHRFGGAQAIDNPPRALDASS